MRFNRTTIIVLAIIITLGATFGVLQKLVPPSELKTSFLQTVTIPNIENFLQGSDTTILRGASNAPCGDRIVNDLQKYQYADDVRALLVNCIVDGYSDGTFRPHNEINRAELTKTVISAFFSENEIQAARNYYLRQGSIVAGLPDVLLTEWYGPFVALGLLEEIISGYKGETIQLYGITGHPFKPGNPVTHAEAFKILYSAKLAVSDNDTRDTLQNEVFYAANDFTSLPSVSREDWTRPYLIAGGELGIFDKEFIPLRHIPIDRGTFAHLAVSVMSY